MPAFYFDSIIKRTHPRILTPLAAVDEAAPMFGYMGTATVGCIVINVYDH
jgi:hypothetical protein